MLLLAATIAVLFGIAWCGGEGELVRRIGASLSGVGALLVIYQTSVEARFDREHSREAENLASFTPLEREMAARILQDRQVTRKLKRGRIIVLIAMLVFVGETLHGWGDILLLGAAYLIDRVAG